MMPISAKVFFLENSPEKWSFAINNDHVDKIGASVDGIHTATYYHVDSFRNNPETLSIQGDYISDEMGIQVKIVYENDEWVLYHPEIGRVILIPLFKKGFNSRIGLIVWEGENTDQFRLLYDDISRLYFHRID